MARRLRVQYPGAIYHVMNRGDHQEPIFKDDADRNTFLRTLDEACGKTDWEVHAYCLMSNHFHLVLETPKANLVAGMKWFLGTYTGRFNRRHQKFGHLFAGRYKSLAVDGSGNGYLRTLCEYVHLNPVRAKLIGKEQPLKSYPWSSFPSYLMPPRKRASWLRIDRVLGESGIGRDTKTARNHFERLMEQRRSSAEDKSYQPIRRGWCWGDKKFRKELLGQMSEKIGANHYGDERWESEEEKARMIIEEELRRARLAEADLKARPKNDPTKIKVGMRLRRQTTMPAAWIAAQLHMGSRYYATNLLLKGRKGRS